MCRGCVLIFILFILAETLRAQPLHLSEDSMSVSIGLTEDIIELQNHVINDLTEIAPIQWQKSFIAPDSWTVNLCDDVACFGEYYNSNILYLEAGDSSQLKGQFFADIPGVAVLTVSVTGLNIDGQTYTVHTAFSVTKTTDTALPEVHNLLQVHPNPSKDRIQISLDGNYAYQILDMMGRLKTKGDLGSGQHQISLADLYPGTYILRLDSQKHTQSILIQKMR